MSETHRAARLVAPVILLVAFGCSAEEAPQTAPSPTPSPSSPSAMTAAPPAAPPHRVGSCHALSMSEATAPVDARGPVPCRRPHTSVTVKVGDLAPVADGHLLALDSETVRAQIAASCPDSADGYLGGDRVARRLSRFEVVWFSPSLEQADAGADWYRCDVVAVRSEGRLLRLPARLQGVLDRDGALDRFGTCGTAAPDARTFDRVACSERHTWRAVDVVDLPKDARHLAKNAAADADRACKDIAAQRADGALTYTWSFEWPTRSQWRSGQRYGYCWVPESRARPAQRTG